jgi:hypothetical protein
MEKNIFFSSHQISITKYINYSLAMRPCLSLSFLEPCYFICRVISCNFKLGVIFQNFQDKLKILKF